MPSAYAPEKKKSPYLSSPWLDSSAFDRDRSRPGSTNSDRTVRRLFTNSFETTSSLSQSGPAGSDGTRRPHSSVGASLPDIDFTTHPSFSWSMGPSVADRHKLGASNSKRDAETPESGRYHLRQAPQKRIKAAFLPRFIVAPTAPQLMAQAEVLRASSAGIGRRLRVPLTSTEVCPSATTQAA